jgi:hypothetical protein
MLHCLIAKMPRYHLFSQVWRMPAGARHDSTGKIGGVRRSAPEISRSVAFTAMCQSAHQVGATLHRRLIAFGSLVRVKVQAAPNQQGCLRSIGPTQRVSFVWLMHRRTGLQECKQGISVLSTYMRIARVRECGTQKIPVFAFAIVQGVPEVFTTPTADASAQIGSYVA